MDKSNLKDEYLDVSDNIRHWNTLRFAELTIHRPDRCVAESHHW
jgi:hypothetical protein